MTDDQRYDGREMEARFAELLCTFEAAVEHEHKRAAHPMTERSRRALFSHYRKLHREFVAVVNQLRAAHLLAADVFAGNGYYDEECPPGSPDPCDKPSCTQCWRDKLQSGEIVLALKHRGREWTTTPAEPPQ